MAAPDPSSHVWSDLEHTLRAAGSRLRSWTLIPGISRQSEETEAEGTIAAARRPLLAPGRPPEEHEEQQTAAGVGNGAYRQVLADEAEDTQHAQPLSVKAGPGRIMVIALAALLLLGLGTFGATYVAIANSPAGPVSPPECRKSAVLVITAASSLGHPHQDGSAKHAQRQALVWSGKGHRADLMFQDLFAMDLASRQWWQVYDHTDGPQDASSPVSRWKAVAAYSEQLQSMVLMGGDSILHPHGVNRFLDDLWFLDTDVSFPAWRVSPADNDTEPDQEEEIFDEPALNKHKGSHPIPRRAHAGAVVDFEESPHLVISGGKAHSGAVLGDVWSVSLDSTKWPAGLWQQLWQPGVSEGPAPVARKGHIAVAVPGPALFIWGGRNDSAYMEDGWLFHLANNTWEEVLADETVHQPRGRDHMGAFYFDGAVYMYGGRGGPSYGKSGALADLWSFSFDTHQWSKLHIAGKVPPARFLFSLAFYTETVQSEGAGEWQDPRMLIYGGETLDHANPSLDGCYLSDLWEFSLLNRSWTELSPNVPCQKRCAERKSGRRAWF